jgi:hypothetical protein
MIYLNLTIRNPWSDKFAPVYGAGSKLTENKAWEFEIYQCDSIVEIEGRVTVRQDHAGFELGLGLFGYVMRFKFYDTRHWDYKNNTWETYNG